METKSVRSGEGIRTKRRPSVVTYIAPVRPTSQQIDGEGDDPPVRVVDSGSVAGCHCAPPVVERSTRPGPTTRQRVIGSGETTSSGANAWRAEGAVSVLRARDSSAGGGAAAAVAGCEGAVA